MSDVCLLLEGTYPFVTGGVSTCVYQMIKETPHINYFLVYIGAAKNQMQDYKYPIPDNVKLIRTINLFDYNLKGTAKNLNIKFDWENIFKFHRKSQTEIPPELQSILETFFHPETRVCDPIDLLQSQDVWHVLEKIYMSKFRSISFIDYFYTWRFTHFPLFNILKQDLPVASVYHSLCTGYAGLLGCMAKMRYKAPFILTEHGIYTNERKIEISQAEWIYQFDSDPRAKKSMSYFKEWWIKIFDFMGRLAYEQADVITTLHSQNKERQIAYGAKEEKIRLIPNGINYEEFSSIAVSRQEHPGLNISLVGRVVPIKDVKTFIKAIGIVYEKVHNVKVFIVGPTDEDEGYYEDCRSLVITLGLEEIITFTGKVDVKTLYAQTDLLVLSSISEGQPMVILEAYCLGIPVVTTDVGGCRDLVEGHGTQDRNIGASGLVVPMGSAEKLATAMITLLENEKMRKEFGENAKKRVHEFYREELTVGKYLELYNKLLAEKF